jgi:hypothetical protein
MLIEYRILKEKGENFKSKIYDLKKSGLFILIYFFYWQVYWLQ